MYFLKMTTKKHLSSLFKSLDFLLFKKTLCVQSPYVSLCLSIFPLTVLDSLLNLYWLLPGRRRQSSCLVHYVPLLLVTHQYRCSTRLAGAGKEEGGDSRKGMERRQWRNAVGEHLDRALCGGARLLGGSIGNTAVLHWRIWALRYAVGAKCRTWFHRKIGLISPAVPRMTYRTVGMLWHIAVYQQNFLWMAGRRSAFFCFKDTFSFLQKMELLRACCG